MGIAANKFRLLFLAASKSDIEYKVLTLNQKRKALMDSAESLSRDFADNIFQSGQRSDLYNGALPGVFPGMGQDSPFIDPSDETPFLKEKYEAQIAVIHSMDKEYEIEIKKLESFYQAKKTEIDSVKEMLKKNIEKEYKAFGGSSS